MSETENVPTPHPQDRAAGLIIALWKELADEEGPGLALDWIVDTATRMHDAALERDAALEEAAE